MRSMCLTLVVAVALSAFPSIDAPAGGGSISGVITPADRCTRVEALDRKGRDPRKPRIVSGQYDPKTGRFHVTGLADAAYDLRIYLAEGTIEGMDLRPEPGRDDRAFSEQDRKTILTKIEKFPERFSDILRPLYINGNGSHAKVLVEKIRYRSFHSGKAGERNWRVEVWLYDYHYGGWMKRQHGWHVVARVRTNVDMQPAAFRGLTRLFDPKLGGIDIEEGKAVADFRYAIPDKLDMAMGKIPGSIEKQAAEHKKKKEKEIVY